MHVYFDCIGIQDVNEFYVHFQNMFLNISASVFSTVTDNTDATVEGAPVTQVGITVKTTSV